MLIIRSEHTGALEEAQWRRFEQDVEVRLRENFGCDWEEPNLRAFIRDGVARARHHQIHSEYDCRRFIEYAMEFGDNFETLPWAAPVLADPSLNGRDKMDRIDAIGAFSLR